MVNDCFLLSNRFGALETETSLDMWANECSKMVENIQKKMDAILKLESVAADMLEFHVNIEDAYSELNAFASLATAYKNLNPKKPTKQQTKLANTGDVME
eukprot:3751650-Heterocapsa_arctica.AAC.1